MQSVPGAEIYAEFYQDHLERARALPEADRSADVRAWLAAHDALDAAAPLLPELQPGAVLTEPVGGSAALAALLQFLGHSFCHPPAEPVPKAYSYLQHLGGQLPPLVYVKRDGCKAHRDTPWGDPGFVGSLVVCLPVAHDGGALRVSQGRHRHECGFGEAAARGEVQWAAFFSDAEQEVLEVTEGTRVALAYELFARPDTASGPPAPLRALPSGADQLLSALREALESSSFMVNGGRLGFPCKHAYPQSLVAGVDEQGVRAMLKGNDAAVLHVLAALGVPAPIVRVWNLDTEMEMEVEMWEGDAHWRARARAMVASPLGGAAGKTTARGGGRAPRRREGEWEADFLRKDVGAQLETGIEWLGGRSAFPEFTLGTIGIFYVNEGAYPQEFYTALGIVAEVPAFVDRPSVQAAELAWAGRRPEAPPSDLKLPPIL